MPTGFDKTKLVLVQQQVTSKFGTYTKGVWKKPEDVSSTDKVINKPKDWQVNEANASHTMDDVKKLIGTLPQQYNDKANKGAKTYLATVMSQLGGGQQAQAAIMDAMADMGIHFTPSKSGAWGNTWMQASMQLQKYMYQHVGAGDATVQPAQPAQPAAPETQPEPTEPEPSVDNSNPPTMDNLTANIAPTDSLTIDGIDALTQINKGAADVGIKVSKAMKDANEPYDPTGFDMPSFASACLEKAAAAGLTGHMDDIKFLSCDTDAKTVKVDVFAGELNNVTVTVDMTESNGFPISAESGEAVYSGNNTSSSQSTVSTPTGTGYTGPYTLENVMGSYGVPQGFTYSPGGLTAAMDDLLSSGMYDNVKQVTSVKLAEGGDADFLDYENGFVLMDMEYQDNDGNTQTDQIFLPVKDVFVKATWEQYTVPQMVATGMGLDTSFKNKKGFTAEPQQMISSAIASLKHQLGVGPDDPCPFKFTSLKLIDVDSHTKNPDYWNCKVEYQLEWNNPSDPMVQAFSTDGVMNLTNHYADNKLIVDAASVNQVSAGASGGTDFESMKAKAFSATTQKDADAKFRAASGAAWQTMTAAEKDGLYQYTTAGFNYANHLLRYQATYPNPDPHSAMQYGYIQQHGKAYEKQLNAQNNATTSALKKSKLQQDTMLYRKCNDFAIESLFGLPANFLKNASEEQLNGMVGMVATEHGFGSAFSYSNGPHDINNPELSFLKNKEVTMEILAPAGTQAIYAEPFSASGGNAAVGKSWDGKSGQSKLGAQNETILQRESTYKIMGVTKQGTNKYHVQVMIVGQNPDGVQIPD